ncbi:MAG: cyclic nucleotide-binding domain-containing protein [Archangium sp.]
MDVRELKDKASQLFTKGKFAKAAETYEEYCAADRKDHQARLRCGDAWAKAGKKDKAIIAYSAAAEGFAKDGFLPRAIAASKLVLELDPSHKGVQKMLAELYAQKSGGARGGSSRSGVFPAPAAAAGQEMEISRNVSAPVTSNFTNRRDAIDLDGPLKKPTGVTAKTTGFQKSKPEVPSPMNRADALELPEYEIPMDDGPSLVGGMAAAKGPTPTKRSDAIEIEVEEEREKGPKALSDTAIDIDVSLGGMPPPPPGPAARAAPPPPPMEVEIPIEGEPLSHNDQLPPELQLQNQSYELEVEVTPPARAPAAPSAVYDLTDSIPEPKPSVPVFELTEEIEDAPAPPPAPPPHDIALEAARRDAEERAAAEQAAAERAAAEKAAAAKAALEAEAARIAADKAAAEQAAAEKAAAERAAAEQAAAEAARVAAEKAAAEQAAAAKAAAKAAAEKAAAEAAAAKAAAEKAAAEMAAAKAAAEKAAAEQAAAEKAAAERAAAEKVAAEKAAIEKVAAEKAAAEKAEAEKAAIVRAAAAATAEKKAAEKAAAEKSASLAAPPGLKPKKSEAVPPPASTPSSRIWLPPGFKPEGADAAAPPPAASAPADPMFDAATDLERSLEAFARFDPDVQAVAEQPAPPPAASPPRAPVAVPSGGFTELDLEGDSLLHAVEAAASRAPQAAQIAAQAAHVHEEQMEAEEAPTPGGLPRIPLFSDLPEDAFIALFEKCPLQRFDEGQLVFEQGDKADAFYVICAGKVRVFRTDASQRRELATLEEGSFFGEMALLSEAPRSASVEAGSEDTQVLAISAEILTELSAQHPPVATALRKFCRQRLLSNLMNSAAIFAPFNKSDRRDLVQKFRARDVKKGDVVVKQGQASDGLYVILSGEVEVDANGRRIAALKEGEVFGEMSLLTRSPASATVRATRHTSLLRLPKQDFDSLILSHPQVLEHVSVLVDERKKADTTRKTSEQMV